MTANCNNCGGGTGSGDCFGINEGTHPDGDDILGCISAPAQGMGSHCNGDGQSGPKSLHTGGVHALMCDGSVRFIGQNLDGGAMARSQPKVMDRSWETSEPEKRRPAA